MFNLSRLPAGVLIIFILFSLNSCQAVSKETLRNAKFECVDIVVNGKNNVEAFYFSRRLNDLFNQNYFGNIEDCEISLIVSPSFSKEEFGMVNGWFSQSFLDVSAEYQLINKLKKVENPKEYKPRMSGKVSVESNVLNSKTNMLALEMTETETKKLLAVRLADQLYDRVFNDNLRRILLAQDSESKI